MDDSITSTILSGLMGFFGGLVTIPINAVLNYLLKRDELKYAHQLDVIAKQRELLLQHKLELETRGKDDYINEIKERLNQIEEKLVK